MVDIFGDVAADDVEPDLISSLMIEILFFNRDPQNPLLGIPEKFTAHLLGENLDDYRDFCRMPQDDLSYDDRYPVVDDGIFPDEEFQTEPAMTDSDTGALILFKPCRRKVTPFEFELKAPEFELEPFESKLVLPNNKWEMMMRGWSNPEP